MNQDYSSKNNYGKNFIENFHRVSFVPTAKEKSDTVHSLYQTLTFAFLFLLFSTFSFGQLTTVPSANTNTGSINDPLGTFWGFERTALLYTSAEIGVTGTINQVGFYLNSVSTPGAATDVRIYMKMRTTLMTVTSTYATETTGATLVYGPTTIASGSFTAGTWISIPLVTPFAYTGGTDNLEVIVETNTTGSGNEGSSGKQLRYSTAPSTQYYQYWNADTTAPSGNGTLSANRPNIQLDFVSVPPTITSLGSTSGCVGSSITINGTNLTGATAGNVKIGGTAVTSITSNSGTVLVAVVGAGTTGTVEVTTAGGTATSAATFTVNQLPVITIQPSTPASVCAGAGTRTISVTATGATTYQWRRNSVNLTDVAPYSNVTTATLTITNPAVGDVGNFDVIVGNAAPCNVTSNAVALTTTSVPSASITPNPTNAAIGVCYSGAGPITSVSWAATATATTYDVFFGAGSLPGSVTSNVGTNSYATGTLSANTTYYWKVVAKNACGDAVGSSTWTFTTLSSSCYCAPTYSSGPGTIDQIANVTLGALNNSSGASGSPYYTFYDDEIIPDLQQSSTASVSVSFGSDSNQYAAVWIDFDQNGTFQAGEGVVSAVNAGTSGTTVINVPVPIGATLGNTRMRVRGGNDSALLTSQACGASSSSFGETEEYIVNIIASPPCATPTAQPTALILTPTGTTIAGSFTLASPVADNYLVVINTTAAVPSPVNGTTYSIGGTVGAGNTVVDIDSNATFTATGLTLSTIYYVFVFSYNSSCTGGPLYYSSSPLNGNTTTLSTNYCTPTGNINCTVSDYINNVTFNTLNNTSTCSAGGYINYSATGTQTTSVLKGSNYNFNLSVGSGSGTHGAAVWIDFNQDSDFNDIGEFFLIGNAIAASTTTTINIPIPGGATAGATRMRVRYAYNLTVLSTMSCVTAGTYGETEDYTITIVDPAPCVTPTAQPTALILTPTGTTIAGSFTAAVPTADNYLVVINTTGTTPAPVNGTTYSIGGAVPNGTVVDIDNNTGFNATGLTISTTYYLFVFSYSTACTGGPLYYTTTPLNGSTTTLATNYCTPSVSASQESLVYLTNISFVGSLNDTSNNSTYSSSPRGYQDFSALPNLAKQAQGEGLNISMQTSSRGYIKAWVDWNKDGDFADAGETVYDTGGVATYSTTFGFIIPIAQAVGNYRVRIRINGDDTVSPYDPDANSTFNSCGNIDWHGETEDYLFTVVASCSALVTSVTDGVTCGTGTVDLVATGSGATIHWYANLTGGVALATTASGATWTTPSISTNTTYYVTSDNGCESLVRTAIDANVNPIPTLDFTPSSPVVCGEDVVISLNASGDTQQVYLINENFETGLGVFSNTNILSTSEDAKTAWQSRTSTFVPAQQVWFPAISSGFGTNKFAMTTSDVGSFNIHNALVSATVNSTNFLDLTLSFKIFYSRYYVDNTNLPNDYVTVDVSTDGGGAWTELTRYISDVATGTRFDNITFDLAAYINQTNLKVRIRYYGEWCDGVAVDDVKLFGFIPLNTAFDWTSTTPVNAFTDAACTIPYSIATPVATVYIKPTLAQLEDGSYDFTANATLSNGCSASQLITVTNTSKVWQNGAPTDWNDPNNWKPAGVPTSSNCVIIPENTIISGSGYDAYAKNLTVKSTGSLNLQSNNNLTVTEWVNVDAGGVFEIKNNASLIQINNVANTGSINMERITQPMYKLDYTYWGSPVSSAFTLGSLSPGSSLRYTWTPSVGGVSGNWIFAAAGTAMTTGKGFIVRAPDSYSTNPATKVPYTANFIGTPNNGDLSIPITYGTMGAGATDDKWNLISNPYPSAINADTFLNLASNIPVIGGTIYFWTHNSPPTTAFPDPFYSDFVSNYTEGDYASWNKTGGVGTIASTGGPTPTGYIAAGSAFFVKSLAVAGNASFNNSMRVTNNNNQFYRSANQETLLDADTYGLDKNRIWLNLTNNSGAFSQILVGYIQGATDAMDRDFDGTRFGGNGVTFYSIHPEANLGIQGRPLPFDLNDQVPLGYNSTAAGTFSIRIDHLDGLFDSQNIYLEDKDLNVIHNLKTAPYVFTTASGNFNGRFVLRYTESALGNDDFALINNVKVVVNEKVTVRSSNQVIKKITVYDLLGRQIDSYKNINTNQFILNRLEKTATSLIVKITLENDVIVTEKIIY